MTVVRSQACTLQDLVTSHPSITHLVVSPGPGHPLKDSGISIPAIQHYAGKLPVLGVCMGLQCMYAAYGGVVDGAGEIVHGKTSLVRHDGKGLFKDVAQDIQSTRYHSLAARIGSLPPDMEVTSRTAALNGEGEGIVMGIRHKVHAMEAVQYHPESILSQQGKDLLANFLRLRGGTWADNPTFGVSSPSETTTSEKASRSMPSTSSSLPTILQKICKQRILDVAEAKAVPGASPADLATKIKLHVPPAQIDFHQRVLRRSGSTASAATPHVALMAEIKRASPSKGSFVTATTPSPPQIALSYALAGASAISVLTEPTWFKGTLSDMLSVRLALEGVVDRPAVLRKDFVLDTYQIDEARCFGADTVLLIVACLDDATLKKLYDHSVSLGMEPLVEVNNPPELERALALGAKVIGVNNRNLHDFQVDMGTTSRLADLIRLRRGEQGAAEVVLCALSGITGRKDVEGYVKEGVGAVLVGEALMKAQDKGAFVRQLLGTDTVSRSTTELVGPPDGIAAAPTVNGTHAAPRPTRPLVKICGIKTPEAARVAIDAGADMLGFVFAPKSKRKVSVAQAREIALSIRSSKLSEGPAPAEEDPSPDWFAFRSRRLASLASRRRPLLVGVFQSVSLPEILEAVDSVPLDVVQLHGHEPLDWAKLIEVPVIKAFHVDEDVAGAAVLDNPELTDVSRPGYHAVPLLDTKVSKAPGALSGGAGRPFDWSIARSIADRSASVASGTAIGRLPIVLSGGLDETNVARAIEEVRPWAIDVSGGVETDGQKDLDKIKRFLEAAKGATAS